MGVGFRVEWVDYDQRKSGRWLFDNDSLSFQIEAAIRNTITCNIEKEDTSGLRELVRGLVENVIENYNTKFDGIVMKTITGLHQEHSNGMVIKTVKDRYPNWFNFNRAGGKCEYYCHLYIEKVMWSFNQIETRDFVSLDHNCSLAHKASVIIATSIITNFPGLKCGPMGPWAYGKKTVKNWKGAIRKLGLPEILGERVMSTLIWMYWVGIGGL